jgi:hypothetical protein
MRCSSPPATIALWFLGNQYVRERILAAAAQNIKRLVRFLSQGLRSILPATT